MTEKTTEEELRGLRKRIGRIEEMLLRRRLYTSENRNEEHECPECGHTARLAKFIDGWALTCPECGQRFGRGI